MAERPKRRISKDNPYRIKYYDKKNVYTVSFEDSRKEIQEIEINMEVFSAFNEFELKDLSQMNKDDLHRDNRFLDNSEKSEIIVFSNILNYTKSVEDIVEEKIMKENLNKIIEELPNIQQRRLKKYYYEEKTFEEIAKEENCTKRAVKFSVDIALKKISQKIKK